MVIVFITIIQNTFTFNFWLEKCSLKITDNHDGEQF